MIANKTLRHYLRFLFILLKVASGKEMNLLSISDKAITLVE
jgi:hypothetical protein